jgi:HPt (histidine-containing phosphotransfer) domain-containing protein
VKTAAPPVSRPDPAVATLLPAFLTRRKEDARALENALAAADFATVAAIGHRLKGLGSTYGFDAITKAGRDLEAAATQCDIAAARQTLNAYAQLLAELA